MRKIVKLLVPAIAIMLSFASCTQAQQNSIDAKIFARTIAENKNILLIDVRTPQEYAEGHIKGAKNIDWYGENFKAEIGKLDKNKTVYVYCRSGKRSAEAAEEMRRNGFKNVYELQGGIMAWEEAKQPIE